MFTPSSVYQCINVNNTVVTRLLQLDVIYGSLFIVAGGPSCKKMARATGTEM